MVNDIKIELKYEILDRTIEFIIEKLMNNIQTVTREKNSI
jgi:hypothetical protein